MTSHAKGKFEIEISREYLSFIDLLDYFDQEYLSNYGISAFHDLESSEEVAEFFSDSGDCGSLIYNSRFLVLFKEEVEVTIVGSCSNCGFTFEESAWAFREEFCTECGQKREISEKNNFVSLPASINRVLKKEENWEAFRYSAEAATYLKSHKIGRYIGRHINFSKNYVESNTSLENIQSSFGDDTNWEREDCEASSESDGASCLGICPKCAKDFRPLEKFCSSCGTKQTWFDDLT